MRLIGRDAVTALVIVRIGDETSLEVEVVNLYKQLE
jgi:hypothetical protein